MNSSDAAPALASLKETGKAMLALRAEMQQRERQMHASIDQQMQALRNEVAQTRREVAGIVGGAKTQITQEAREAVTPVAAEYDRAVRATSAHLRGASKTVWMWFAASGAILLLVLIVGWAVLGYYRRELADVKEEFQRYENAVPVVQAFYASDAILCGGRVCTNVDPDARRQGDKRQYRQAKPRPQQ